MDKITLTLKHDTVDNIIIMINEYIDDLYTEAEIYKGYSKGESLNKYIEECKTYLTELKLSVQQAKEKKWEFVPLYLLGVRNKE